jgi:transaldolase
MAEATITAFEDHGTVERTVDSGIEQAETVMHDLRTVGVDMDDVGHALEDHGVSGFHQSFADLLVALDAKARRAAQQ